MRSSRALGCSCVISLSLATIACAEPPDKEIRAAQTALELARAAGADEYAHDGFRAAEDALRHARDAVADRDYRLALNNALDSRERADDAAREAATNKARAQADANRDLTKASAALSGLKAQLSAAAGRAPARLLADAQSRADAEASLVQEARTALGRADYRAALKALDGSAARLTALRRDLEEAIAPPPRKRR